MISVSDVPIGTSTSPAFLTFPTTEKTFVPVDFGVPNPANQSAP